MAIKLEIKGLDATIKRVEELASTIKQDVNDELTAFVNNVARDAKILAPVDEGHLRGSINADNSVNESASVTVSTNYAAYLEFGTRKFAAAYVATLPSDWQTYAATFKGKGDGTFDEFVQSLVAWVKRKGIGATYNIKTRRRDRVGKQSAQTTAEADAYAIALWILRNGIRPHPFLYPAVMKNLPEIRKRMEELTK